MKSRGKAGVILLQDNVPLHTAQVTVAEVASCNFELQTHPPNLADLVSFDFFPFPKFKYQLCGYHFGNNDKIICAVIEFWEDQDFTIFGDGIAMLQHGWTKWIEVKWGTILKNSEKLSCFSQLLLVRLITFWTPLHTNIQFLLSSGIFEIWYSFSSESKEFYFFFISTYQLIFRHS